MTLEKLVSLVPPPKNPLYAGNPLNWQEIQKKTRGILPQCLYHFGFTYGSGNFVGGNSICICNPFDPSFFNNVYVFSEVYKSLRNESPEYYPYNCYPEKNGLFYIGSGDSGGILFYLLLSQDSNEYKIIYNNSSRDLVEFSDLTFFDFLLKFLSNRIEDCPYFQKKVCFVPCPLIKLKEEPFGSGI